jgi:hypothetical protein
MTLIAPARVIATYGGSVCGFDVTKLDQQQ